MPNTDADSDFFYVFSELKPLTAQWRAIGAAFGLHPGTLATINISHPGDPAACLMDVVTEWLNRNYNVLQFGEPTWQRVVEVVAHPAGGNNSALAKTIGERHPGKTVRAMDCAVWTPTEPIIYSMPYVAYFILQLLQLRNMVR